jgi:uncharacterized protein (TIGR02246 family)
VTDDELKARLGIADLMAAASQAGDARKADAYAGCFTEDGVLDLSRGGGGELRGRETIRAWMSAPSVIRQAADGPAGFISHHLTTCKIDLTGPDTATARTYWLVTSPVGLDHNGFYDDRLRRVDGAWLLENRRPRTLWAAADSLTRRRD